MLSTSTFRVALLALGFAAVSGHVIERQGDVITIIGASRTDLSEPTTTRGPHYWRPPPPYKPTTKIDTSDIFITRTASGLTYIEQRQVNTETIIGVSRTDLSEPTTTKAPPPPHKPTTKVDTSDVFITRTAPGLTYIEERQINTETIIGVSRTELSDSAPTQATQPHWPPPHKPTTKVDTSDVFTTLTATGLTYIQRRADTETFLVATRASIEPAPTTIGEPEPSLGVDTSDELVTRTASLLTLGRRNQKPTPTDVFTIIGASRTVLERQENTETILGASRTAIEPKPSIAPVPTLPHTPSSPFKPTKVDTSDLFVTVTAGTLTLIERTKPTKLPVIDTSDVFLTRTATSRLPVLTIW